MARAIKKNKRKENNNFRNVLQPLWLFWILSDINFWDHRHLLKALLDGTYDNDINFEFEISGKMFQQVRLIMDVIYPDQPDRAGFWGVFQ